MKKALSVLFAFIMVFSAIPLSGAEDLVKGLDFGFLSTKVKAANVNDLVFELNSDGQSYCVSGCHLDIIDSLSIPSTYDGKPVTSISYRAFIGCRLTSVTIPGSVTSIDDEAFAYCNSLKSITIPDSVTSIGNAAFAECCYLTSVTIGNGVTGIGESTFAWCKSLTSVTMGNSVTSIGDGAFYYCESLKSITIPDSVTSIGKEAFSGTAYYNNSSNWENGVLYLNNHLIRVKSDTTGDYIIKAGTKCIADHAFEECYILTSVTIPDSVARIGEWTFSGCSSLKSVTIPDGVTSIGKWAFSRCYSLPSVTIPDSVTSIGCNAFASCGGITSLKIPDSVKDIGEFAFFACESLASVTIPGSVTDIGAGAFSDCRSLTSITVDPGNKNYISVNDIIFNKDKTELVCFPAGKSDESYLIPSSVTSVGERAFSGCGNLISVTIPDSVTSICNGAFAACSSLTSVTIPDSITSIGDDAFFGMAYYNNSSNWENGVLYIGNHLIKAEQEITGDYTIKSGTKCIADNSFSDCRSLTNVTIGNGVTSVGKKSFACCYSLKSITIPDSVTSIGKNAFYYCFDLNAVYITDIGAWCGISFGDICSTPLLYAGKLYVNGKLATSIVIPDGVASIGNWSFLGCKCLASVTIPDSVTSIGDEAFAYCDSLKSITIPDSVTSIGESAFFLSDSLNAVYITDIGAWCGISFADSYSNPLKNANNLYVNGKLAKNIVIPDGVTSIGKWAFACCGSLTSVTIPDSVTSIGDEAFACCGSLTSVTIPDSVMNIGDEAFCGCKRLTSATIPGSVTSIGDETFAYCDILKSITIPDSVTSIGELAFASSGLTSVTIPAGVTAIGNSAFSDCCSLTGITVDSGNKNYSSKNGVLFNKNKTKLICYPAGKNNKSYSIPNCVTSISEYAFESCSNLTSVTIPCSVTNIADYTFLACRSLTSVTIPDSVTSIGYAAFRYCSSLTSVTIPDSVMNIGDEAFCGCTSLKSITMPDSVTSIGGGVFIACERLKSVTIPDGVTSIGSSFFADCSSLTSVTIPDSVTSIEYMAFENCGSLTSVTIGKDVTIIDDDAFENCESLTIRCYKNSTAHIYAKEKNIPFVLICKHVYKNGVCTSCGDWQYKNTVLKLGKAVNRNGSVKLTWNAVKGAEKYIVYRKAGSATKWSALKTVTATSYTDKAVKSGTKYTYTVKAICGKVSGKYDTKGLSKLYLSTPSVKSANKNGYISVSWNKVTGAKGYVIYKKTGSGEFKKIATIDKASTVSYKDKSVKSGTKYTYYVKAVNGKTYSSYKACSALMYLAPVKISSATSGKTGITVKWGKVSASKGYVVYRKSGSGSYKKLATVTGATKLSYLDKSAKKGTTYTYYVKAYNGKNKGYYANTKSCKDKY